MSTRRGRKLEPPNAAAAPRSMLAPPAAGARPPFSAAAVLVLALACVGYANSLRNGFVWDDPIILSRQLTAFTSVGAVLITPRNIPQYSPDYYRPLTVASFLLDRAIGGEEPFVYHLSVVLAHAAVSCLVLALGWSLFSAAGGAMSPRARGANGRKGIAAEPAPTKANGWIAATVGGALFAVHPIHTESVAWIAGRSDVLATLLVLAALVAQRTLPRGAARVAAVSGFSLLALGAKETAISVLPLLVLSDVLAPRAHAERARLWWPEYLALGVASASYAALRRAAVGSLVGDAVPSSAVERSAADLIAAVGVYVLKLLWPLPHNAYVDVLPSGVPAVAATIVALLTLAAMAAHAWRSGNGTVTFLIGWLALTLAPSLAIVWKIPEAPIAERYLYLPSVAFCLLAGAAVAIGYERARNARRRNAWIGATILLVAAATVATWSRNRVWRDDLALWSDTAAKSTTAGLPMRSLGVAHLQRGQDELARAYLEQALQRRNGPTGLQVIYNNLGTLAMRAQRYDEARRHYEAALQSYPGSADSLFNLGLAILQGGGGGRAAADAAREYFERAAQLSPHDPDIQAALGQVSAIRGERERALSYLRRALELGPSPAVAENIRSYLAQLESQR